MKKSYTWSGWAIQAITVREWCPWLPGQLRILFHLVLLCCWQWCVTLAPEEGGKHESHFRSHLHIVCLSAAAAGFCESRASSLRSYGFLLRASARLRIRADSDLYRSRAPGPPKPHVNSDSGGVRDCGNCCLSAQRRERLSCNGPPVAPLCKPLRVAAVRGLPAEPHIAVLFRLEVQLEVIAALVKVRRCLRCIRRLKWGSEISEEKFIGLQRTSSYTTRRRQEFTQ